MDAETRKIPSHEVTYARLRDMILFGHLAPGAPVTIQGLITELDAGMTPVREAIRRLTAEGALVLHDNRRVSVPRMTPALLAPDARLLSETGATRAEALFDGHDRFAKPLLAISGVLIGFAVMLNGTFSRFGLWRQMALGAALYVLQFFLANLSDSAAIKDGFEEARQARGRERRL